MNEDRNSEKLKQELATVLASPTFRASPKLSSLLDYLFANQKPGALTQTVIAAEFFGRGSSNTIPRRIPWCVPRSAGCG